MHAACGGRFSGEDIHAAASSHSRQHQLVRSDAHMAAARVCPGVQPASQPRSCKDSDTQTNGANTWGKMHDSTALGPGRARRGFFAEACGRLHRSHSMHMFQKYVKALRIFFFELIMYYEPKVGSKKKEKRPCQDFPLTLPKPARQCIPYVHRA